MLLLGVLVFFGLKPGIRRNSIEGPLHAGASIWHEIVGLHTAAIISLLFGILSLLPARNFPVIGLREFLRKPLFSFPKSRRRARMSVKTPNFPVNFPVNREFQPETG